MKNKKFFKIMSKSAVASALAASLVVPSVTQAANTDIHAADGTVYTATQVLLDKSLATQILLDLSSYKYELNGMVYSYKDIAKLFTNGATSENLAEKITESGLVGEPTSNKGDLTNITSVSALTTSVNLTGGKLELAVNGATVATDVAKLTEAGYTVEFKASDAVFTGGSTSATGELKTLAAGTTFKYQVIVSKDGTKVAESALQQVTVQNQAGVVTEISAINLVVTQNNADIAITSGKLATGDVAKVVVMGKTADMSATDKAVDITAKVTLSSSKPGVLTVSNDGKISLKGMVGDVVITAKSGDISNTLSVNAGNEARKIDATKTTISPTSLTLATSASKTIEVIAKDQYGDAMALQANDIKTEVANNADTAEIAAAVSVSAKGDKEGKHTFTLTAHASNVGTGTVVVKQNTTKLGEIALTVQKAGEAVSYQLETADEKYELDAKTPATTLDLELIGYDKDGLKTGKIDVQDNTTYTFESSDKKVATVDVNGKVTPVAVGTATITIYKTADAFKTPVATREITVKDTTPTISSVETKKVRTITTVGSTAFTDIFTINTVDAVGKKGTAVVDSATGTYDEIKVGSDKVGKVLVVAQPESSDADYYFTAKAEQNNGLTIAGDGKGQVYVYVLDNAGKQVGEVVIDVDIPLKKQAPTVSFEKTVSNVNKGHVKLNGITTAEQYRINGGDWNDATADMQIDAKIGDIIEVRTKKVITSGTEASASKILSLTVEQENIGTK